MKPKLYYGWYIVIAGLALTTFYSAVFGYGWTSFVNPIVTTFGWSMAQISLGSSLRTLETGIFNPVWGVAVDRWSPRRLVLFGALFGALGIFLLSQTKNLVMYYSGFFILGAAASLVTQVLPQTLMARWFKKDVGKAAGLFWMGPGIAGVSVPLVVAIVDKLTWQTTLLYAAFIYLAFGILLSRIYRSRPEDYGLSQDGMTVPTKDTAKEAKTGRSGEFGSSVREALKTRAFWHLYVVNLFQHAAMGTMSLYAMPYLTSLGMDRPTASRVIMLYMLATLFTRLPIGMLSDIFRKSYIVAFSITLQTAGVFLFWLMDGTKPFWFILVFAIIYGIGLGGVNPLRVPIQREYFGTRHFGSIFGLFSIFTTVATVVSPPLAGWLYDTYHNYKIWWLALIGLGILALIAILTIPRPPKQGSNHELYTSPK